MLGYDKKEYLGFFEKNLSDVDFYEILRAMGHIKGFNKEKNLHFFNENLKKSFKSRILLGNI